MRRCLRAAIPSRDARVEVIYFFLRSRDRAIASRMKAAPSKMPALLSPEAWAERYPRGMPLDAFYDSLRPFDESYIASSRHWMLTYGVATLSTYEMYERLHGDTDRLSRTWVPFNHDYLRCLAHPQPPRDVLATKADGLSRWRWIAWRRVPAVNKTDGLRFDVTVDAQRLFAFVFLVCAFMRLSAWLG
jgi:hypothetical protein